MKLSLKSMAIVFAGLALASSCKSKKPSSVKMGKNSTATGIAYNKKGGSFFQTIVSGRADS